MDISHPLVEIATDRARATAAGNAGFVVADAQTHTTVRSSVPWPQHDGQQFALVRADLDVGACAG